MSTTVHIPERLLRRLDARAKALGISRNRAIVEAIERSIGSNEGWPPELVRMLEQPLDADMAGEVEASLRGVGEGRTNRGRPPKL